MSKSLIEAILRTLLWSIKNGGLSYSKHQKETIDIFAHVCTRARAGEAAMSFKVFKGSPKIACLDYRPPVRGGGAPGLHTRGPGPPKTPLPSHF